MTTPEALGGFDPRATYDDASLDYEDASRDFWQFISLRTVDRLGLQAGERVPDVPCGTGHSLLAAAERVGPAGRVVGLDYAEQMLAIARDKVRATGLGNVEIEAGDMTAVTPPDEPYDAVICALGLFFADDMPGLVRSFHDLVRPGGGRLAVTVFGENFFDPMRTVFVEAVGEIAPQLEIVQPWRRAADLGAFRGVFEDAGVGEVSIETDYDDLPLTSGHDWWRIVMGSGLRRTVDALGPELAGRVRARCDAYIENEGADHILVRSRYAILVRS